MRGLENVFQIVYLDLDNFTLIPHTVYIEVNDSKGAEMERKILAEGQLFNEAIMRVFRNEDGDHCTEYVEGEYGGETVHPSLEAAMAHFTQAIIRAEIAELRYEYGVTY